MQGIQQSEKARANEQGMTLIELMICILMISVGVLASLRMQIQAMSGNATAMKVSEATIAIEDEIDTLLGLAVSDATLSAGDYSTTGGDANQYTINYTIQDITGVDPDDATATITKYKQITVTTTWRDRGKTKTMTNSFIKI